MDIPMRLFSSTLSTYARRVHIYFLENGLEIPISYVNLLKLENRSRDFLVKNPFGKVPTLQIFDDYIPESINIILYLEDKYSPVLDIFLKAKIRTLLFQCDYYFANVISPIIFQKRLKSGEFSLETKSSPTPNRKGLKKEAEKEKEKELELKIQQISKMLYKYFNILSGILGERKFFFRESFSLIEIAHAPFIEFLDIFSFRKKENIEKWLERIKKNSSYKKTAYKLK